MTNTEIDRDSTPGEPLGVGGVTVPDTETLKALTGYPGHGGRALPWKVTPNNAVTDKHGWSIFVDEENRTVGTATPQDAHLVALAPVLAHEVIRLREEPGTLTLSLATIEALLDGDPGAHRDVADLLETHQQRTHHDQR